MRSGTKTAIALSFCLTICSCSHPPSSSPRRSLAKTPMRTQAPLSVSSTTLPYPIHGETTCGYAAVAQVSGRVVGLGDCAGFFVDNPADEAPLSARTGTVIFIEEFQHTNGPFTSSNPQVATITSQIASRVTVEARSVGEATLRVPVDQCVEDSGTPESTDCFVATTDVTP